MRDMNPTTLQDFLQQHPSPLLIDVRETHELVHGMLENARHVPMNAIPGMLEQLDDYKDQPVVLICRSGKRSAQVGQFMEQNGFSDIINLQGGMNAWAEQIDPEINTY